MRTEGVNKWTLSRLTTAGCYLPSGVPEQKLGEAPHFRRRRSGDEPGREGAARGGCQREHCSGQLAAPVVGYSFDLLCCGGGRALRVVANSDLY